MEKMFINDPEAYPPGSYGAEMARIQNEIDTIRAENTLADLACKLGELLQEIKERFLEIIRKVVDVLTPYLKEAMKWVKAAWRYHMKEKAMAAGMGRYYQLAFFSKKRRTRKKNMRKLIENVEDEV